MSLNRPIRMNVAYVSVIEDTVYLVWQQQLQLHNFKQLGIADQLWIVVLYSEATPNPCIDVLRQQHPVPSQVRVYQNTQPLHFYSKYKAMNKPWGIAQLLQEKPNVGQCLYSLDSDVFFKQTPFSQNDTGSPILNDDRWYGSNCASYLSRRHWMHEKRFSAKDMARVVGIVQGMTLANFTKLDDCCIGAQLLFKDVTPSFFLAVAHDAWCIYDALRELHDDLQKPNQFWVAEMLSFVLHMLRVKGAQDLATHTCFDFAWATHTVNDAAYAACNIVHMAGACSLGTFDKQKHVTTTPWDDFGALDQYTAGGASADYVQLIRDYYHELRP